MKKITASLLVLVMTFALCACGKAEAPGTLPQPTSTPAPAQVQGWELDSIVDDFGDATDKTCLRGIFTGNFSNTATTDSELTAVVFFSPAVSNEEMLTSFTFRLLEYNDHPATYTSGDSLTMKVKIDDEFFEEQLAGVAPNGDLYLSKGLNKASELYKHIYNTLLKEQDVRCIVEIGSSKYSFTILGKDFVTCGNSMMKTYGYDQMDISKYPVK